MDTVLLVNAWFGGIVAGCTLTTGLIELISGRFAVKLGRGDWSVSQVRISALALCIAGLNLAIYVLVMALRPVWLDGFVQTSLVILVSLGASMILLRMHHDGRWPFVRPGLEENR